MGLYRVFPHAHPQVSRLAKVGNWATPAPCTVPTISNSWTSPTTPTYCIGLYWYTLGPAKTLYQWIMKVLIQNSDDSFPTVTGFGQAPRSTCICISLFRDPTFVVLIPFILELRWLFCFSSSGTSIVQWPPVTFSKNVSLTLLPLLSWAVTLGAGAIWVSAGRGVLRH